MCALKMLFICLLVGLATGVNIPVHRPQTRHRATCAQIDFNNPTKVTYTNSFHNLAPVVGLGPVVGHGMNPIEAEQMLNTTLTNVMTLDDHQYKTDKIISAIKCIMINNLYEFHVNLMDRDDRSKNCVVQIYKNYQELPDGMVTAVVISCPDEPQYVKAYTEVYK